MEAPGTSVGREMRRSCGNEDGTEETQAVPLPGVEGGSEPGFGGSSGSARCQQSNCPTAPVVLCGRKHMAGESSCETLSSRGLQLTYVVTPVRSGRKQRVADDSRAEVSADSASSY